MARKRIIVQACDHEVSRARFVAAMRGEMQGNYVTVHGNAGITEAERQRRQAAADYALATVGLSGFVPSAEAQERVRRFVNGEIDMVELVGEPSSKDGN